MGKTIRSIPFIEKKSLRYVIFWDLYLVGVSTLLILLPLLRG